MDKLRDELSAESGVDGDHIFVDRSSTPSVPYAPSSDEAGSVLLMAWEGGKAVVTDMPLSDIPAVSALPESMSILRVYTSHDNRNKVEIAARSILGESA